MISVDTNILVRACLEDHPKQAYLSKRLLTKLADHKKLFISSYAILELAWVLKVNHIKRAKIADILLNLVESAGSFIGQKNCVLRAIESYRTGKADFGDYLILAESAQNKSNQLATFDQKLLKTNEHCHHPEIWIKN